MGSLKGLDSINGSMAATTQALSKMVRNTVTVNGAANQQTLSANHNQTIMKEPTIKIRNTALATLNGRTEIRTQATTSKMNARATA